MSGNGPCVRVEHIGNATIYCGDCRDILPVLGCADAIITDPPYGIGYDWSKRRKSRNNSLSWGNCRDPERIWQESTIVGDDARFDPSLWLKFPQAILWGADNYEGLPSGTKWLVWDKRRDSTPDDFGDAELAWTSLRGVIRIHRQVWRGIVREGEENVANSPKYHPAQKPVALMSWCVDMTKGTVCDPYMGSGTTGVASARLGRPFIGVEIHEPYFEAACRRIEEAMRQTSLLVELPPAEDPAEARMVDLFAEPED